MRISERGQITIPKALRDRFGMNHNVEVEMTPTPRGILIRKRAAPEHPVERVYGLLGKGDRTDEYLEEIRGGGDDSGRRERPARRVAGRLPGGRAIKESASRRV